MTKRQLASLYIAAVVLAGSAAVAYATVVARPVSPDFVMLALLATIAAVSNSCPDSSGCAWMWWRTATSSAPRAASHRSR